MNEKKRIFIVGTVWPEVTSSAAGFRDRKLIDAFLSAQWEVFYASPSQENTFTWALQGLGVKTFFIQANDSSVDGLLREVQPHIVLFDRFIMEEQFSFRVKENCPEALRILDTQDLHFLRRARVNALKNGASLSSIYQNQISLFSEDLLRECASIYRSDLTLVLSDFEMGLLTETYKIPEELLYYLPFSYGAEELNVQKAKFAETKNFFFIGNFRHAPNWDAVQWLAKELWPKMHTYLPEAEVHVYGAYPSKEAMNLDSPKNGFRVFGPLENHLEHLKKYRVNLAPLRVGAGIKGKITDAWSVGLPTLTTPIGAEGLGGQSKDFGGVCAFTLEEWVSGAVQLYTDEDFWQEKRDQGLTFLKQHMFEEKNTNSFIARVKEAIEKKKNSHNLIQSILWLEQFQKTKYFSRWIEEKNKKLE